jgi:hypothetical protein
MTVQTIHTLKLVGCELSDECLSILTDMINNKNEKLVSLKRLFLDWNSFNDEELLSELVNDNNNIELLSLRSCDLTIDSVNKFCNKIKYNKKLKILNLFGNNKLGLEGIKLILEYVTNQSDNKKIESLNFSNCGLKNDDTKHLIEFFEKKIISEDEKNILLQKEKEREEQIKKLEKAKAKIKDIGP